MASPVAPALGFSHHGHLPSWHLLVIPCCMLAIDPVVVGTAHCAHWKENLNAIVLIVLGCLSDLPWRGLLLCIFGTTQNLSQSQCQ